MSKGNELEDIVNVSVLVDGATGFESATKSGKLDTDGGVHIQRIFVDQRLGCPDMFSVDYELLIDMELTFINSLKEGLEVEIQMGHERKGSLETLFKGEITSVEANFGPMAGTLTIGGYDFSHRLTRGTHTKSFDSPDSPNIDSEDVLSSVVSESGSFKGKSDNLSIKVSSQANAPLSWNISQLAANSFQFLEELGQGQGLALSTDKNRTLELKDVAPSSPVLTICREKWTGYNSTYGLEVRFKLNTARQVQRVEVRGWSPEEKKNIVGVAEKQTITFASGGLTASESTGKALYGADDQGKSLVVVNRPVESQEEADNVAQSILDDIAMDFITGEAVIQGDGKLRPGLVVELSGYGERFDGPYLVTGCEHTYQPSEGAYRTRLTIQRNFVNKT